MLLRQLEKHTDLGLLILRVGIGIAFIFHGYPKLVGGPEIWERLGNVVGIMPVFMGFMAAVAECIGGLLIAIGLFTRLSSLLLMITMIVATYMHISAGDSFKQYSHALESAVIFLSLTLIGAGKYSLYNKLIAQKESKN